MDEAADVAVELLGTEAMLDTLFTVTARHFVPVVEALTSQVRGASLTNLDDTPVLVLDREHPKRRRRGRVWLALGESEWASYFGTPDRTAKAAEKRLGKLAGTLQGDGYKGFDAMARKQGIRLAGCIAHLRRKLRNAMKAHDPRAAEALARVQGLYRVEKLARLRKLEEADLVRLRRQRSVPLMDALLTWAETVAPSVGPGSPLGKARTHLDNQQELLRTYLSDGCVSIDDNAAVRGLRPLTIGRKPWLFFRGDITVERAAVLASVVVTARLHGADELTDLAWLLRQLAGREGSAAQAIAPLPDAWFAGHQQHAEHGRAVDV